MDSQKEKLILQTRQFGEIEIDDDSIYNFPNGILGFEEIKKYVLISEEETAPFKWLISIDEPSIGFPLLSPFYLDLEYNLGKNIDLEKYVLFAIITLNDENGNISANLKAPLVFDIENMTAEQIILPFEKYSTNFVISQRSKE
ncbi:MAG: flagellar assembly protein FliW [Candidatus Kapaibacteriota bacterium]